VTPDEMRSLCQQALAQGVDFAPLIIPRGWKRPKGFPRGELLCVGPYGPVYRFKASKLIAWLDAA
jgi:hypothetical protein